jgi:hypothetical protein
VAGAAALLRAAAPGVLNPVGEIVAVDPAWADEIAHDAQRIQLVPAMLAALAAPDEIWRFAGERAPDAAEHTPHLLAVRPNEHARTEVVVAGTRRVDGELRLHTWFVMADSAAALQRYRTRGHRLFPPLAVRPVYRPRTDVLYLHPVPDVPYRADRLSPALSVFGYFREGPDFPSLVGFEIQDARAYGPRLLEEPGLASLMATPCTIGNETAPLGAQLRLYLSGERT